MARIATEEIERLKREVSVQRLVEARGIELQRHGADLVGRCPFHEDRTPSLVVSPAKNLWHCLGACQTGGSVIDWVMKAEGVSFRHAVELLRADVPLATAPPVTSASRMVKVSTVQKLPAPVVAQAEERELLLQVVGYYQETLKQSPEALAYLESRGLRSSEMIDHFRLGFANRTLGYRLPKKNRQAGEAMRGRLEALGILRESGHEHFNGSVVIPIFDASGAVTEMYGRKITAGLRKGTPLHLYLPGPHRGVWNEAAPSASKEIILCESLIDALTFWCAGYRNVTASYGVEGFTPDHLEAFRRHGTERVLIAYDRDEAGDRAAEKLAERLGAEGIETFRVVFPRGMDANEYALKVTPAEKSLGLVLRQAVWLGKGKVTAAVASIVTAPMEPVVAEAAIKEPAAADELTVDEPTELTPRDGQNGEASAAEESSTRETPEEPITALERTESFEPAPNAAIEAAASPVEPPPMEHPSLVASPAPSAAPPPPELAPQVKGEEILFTVGDRRYRVRGLAKNLALDQLRVNLLVGRGDAFFADNVDLCSARQRGAFVKQAAEELALGEEVFKKDLGQLLLALEGMQEKQIEEAQKPKDKAVTLSEAETAAAVELLRDPKLLERILLDFARCGVVGEEENKLVGYLAAVSRKLEEPLAVIIQSSSAAGKSSLMEAILAFMPAEQRVKYSAMTGQSLFYMGEGDLRHKILAIVEEEGAERASYALKLLQSEGELSIASTGKDPHTGKLVTHEYRVEGPVMILLTTTAIEIDEELLNRCLVLTVDEDREQTRAIHRKQREAQTLAGLLARTDREGILKVHRDAQRLLRPLWVVNPFAEKLTFVDDRTRTRRDHMKYLTLIRTIALLHQYQRPVRSVVHRGQSVAYVEVTLEDIAAANRLAHQVLGRSLDELPPQTRRLLLLLDELVRDACQKQAVGRREYRFTRRMVREATGWGNTQLKVHLARLEEMEYVAVHRGGRGQGQGFVYELCYEGQGRDGRPFLVGLTEVEALCAYDPKRSGSPGERSGPGRPVVGRVSGVGRDDAVGPNVAQKLMNRANGQAATLRANPSEGATRSASPSMTAAPPRAG